MIATFTRDPASRARSARRTAFIRNNGDARRPAELHDHLEPLRPPRLPRPADRPDRRDARRRPSRRRARRSRCIAGARPASAARATAAQYDTEGNRTAGPPVRALDRYEYSIVERQPRARPAVQRRQGRGHGRKDAIITTYERDDPGMHVDGPEQFLYPISPPMSDGALCRCRKTKTRRRSSSSTVVLVPARLARGALRPRRRDQVLPLPQGPARHELVPHARLRDADRVHRAGGHRRDPRDVLQAGPGRGVRVDPVHHERPDARLARPRHAPLGRERLHHPALPPHGARVPLRRLQVPARAELAHRRAAPRRSACSRASRATCCRGTRRRTGRPSSASTSTGRRRSSARSSRTSCAGRRDRRRHARRFYSLHMLADPGRAHRPDRAAPLPRRPPRRHARRRGRTRPAGRRAAPRTAAAGARRASSEPAARRSSE